MLHGCVLSGQTLHFIYWREREKVKLRDIKWHFWQVAELGCELVCPKLKP